MLAVIEPGSLTSLRDRAFVGIMIYTVTRIGTVLGVKPNRIDHVLTKLDTPAAEQFLDSASDPLTQSLPISIQALSGQRGRNGISGVPGSERFRKESGTFNQATFPFEVLA